MTIRLMEAVTQMTSMWQQFQQVSFQPTFLHIFILFQRILILCSLDSHRQV